MHEHLARRRAEQVLAADHVRDAHVGVVDRVGEVVGGHAVGAHDHVVAELGVLEAHRAAHEIVDDARALVGHAQADHRRVAGGLARGALLGAQREAAARVDERPVLALRGRALGRELLGRAVAAVGAALGEELLGDLAVTRPALALDVRAVVAADARALVPLEPDPAQRALDLLDRLGVLARLVGVLDAQHEAPAVVARVEPREQRRAHAADVQQTGWRRREPRADRAGHGGERTRTRAGDPVRRIGFRRAVGSPRLERRRDLHEAVGRATELGCRSLQVFPQSPRVWKPAVHPDENLARFRSWPARPASWPSAMRRT